MQVTKQCKKLTFEYSHKGHQSASKWKKCNSSSRKINTTGFNEYSTVFIQYSSAIYSSSSIHSFRERATICKSSNCHTDEQACIYCISTVTHWSLRQRETLLIDLNNQSNIKLNQFNPASRIFPAKLACHVVHPRTTRTNWLAVVYVGTSPT